MMAGAMAALVVLTGCAPASQEVTVEETVGRPLTFLDGKLGQDAGLLVQDVSPRVGISAAYREGVDPEYWMIVASCSDTDDIRRATSLEVAVVPLIRVDEAKALGDDLANTVDCDGRPHRAHL